MTKLSSLTLKGVSGNEYTFSVYPYGTKFKALGAVYCISKRFKNQSGGFNHNVIYVGETEDLSGRFDNHHKEKCFEKHDANCTCILLENDKSNRLAIEANLVAAHNPTCNG